MTGNCKVTGKYDPPVLGELGVFAEGSDQADAAPQLPLDSLCSTES